MVKATFSFFVVVVSRQLERGDVVVVLESAPETRHKSEGLRRNGRNVTTVSDIGYIIDGNFNNGAQSHTKQRQNAGNARVLQEVLWVGWGSDRVSRAREGG